MKSGQTQPPLPVLGVSTFRSLLAVSVTLCHHHPQSLPEQQRPSPAGTILVPDLSLPCPQSCPRTLGDSGSLREKPACLLLVLASLDLRPLVHCTAQEWGYPRSVSSAQAAGTQVAEPGPLEPGSGVQPPATHLQTHAHPAPAAPPPRHSLCPPLSNTDGLCEPHDGTMVTDPGRLPHSPGLVR